MEIDKNTWIELLVGTIILGTLAFLSARVIDMSQLLGTVDAKVSLTSERVDRIAQALPDVGVRVAYEEVMRPIRTLVLTSTPTRKADGAIEAQVSIIDVDKNLAWSVPVQLSSHNDKRIIGALAWTGAEIDPHYTSMARMQEYAQMTKAKSSIPSFINPATSFILRSIGAKEFLKQAAWLESAPTRSVIALKGDSWEALTESLKDNEAQLAPQASD